MIDLSGVFRIEYTPPPGLPGWKAPMRLRNGPTMDGLAYLLNAAFRGASQQSLWYLGFISGSGFVAISENDTLASHAGWTEFTNGGGNRKRWAPSAAAGGLLSDGFNTILAASGLIRGMFLCTAQTGSVGILYSTAIDPVGSNFGAGGSFGITYDVRLRPRS